MYAALFCTLVARVILILVLQADALSELFVIWDDTVTEAEDKITKLERKREERRRMGLE